MSHHPVAATTLPAGGGCIHTVFETIAGRYPHAKALVHNEQFLTYKALDEKANYVAQCLIDQGIRGGDFVAIQLDRGIDLIVAILGVLKAGAVYLPIDPTYPAARIGYMLSDSGSRYVITSRAYMGSHSGVVELSVESLQGELARNPFQSADPNGLAYVIYTSGTTGNPKGVMVAHAGFVNMCRYQVLVYGLGAGESVLQFASISFDASVYEIFIALLSGSTLVMIDKGVILERKLFLEYIDRQGLTFLLLPPVFLGTLGRPEFKTVKTIVTAGEACNVADALYYSRTKKYFNAYGPTEASVCVSLYQVTPDGDYGSYVPIGKAIPGISFYILDEQLQPVKQGDTGELYVGGIGLAKGYINKPELTQKAFLEASAQLPERAYRTGDLVRQTPQGDLIILGRKDEQVKILGHRIELGAVEHALLQIPPISKVHVCALEHQGEKYLCAYFTASEAIEPGRIRAQLLEQLPAFMVPQWFIEVPRFTMTPNGKIDKKALPSPFAADELLSVPPEGPLQTDEDRLLLICREVLGVSHLSLSDNFFLLGGHSLKAARLSAKINQVFHVELPVAALYQKPHLQEILEAIQTGHKSGYEPIPVTPSKSYYATSAAQKRMFVMHSAAKAEVSYNVSVVLQFQTLLPPAAVAKALQALVDRHDVLRTRFVIQADEIVQQVLDRVKINLFDGGTIQEKHLSGVAKSFVSPFDLSLAPILRAAYYQVGSNGTAVIFDTHHIIADGTSVGLLVEEFVRLLQEQSLPTLSLQYKDYAEWETVQYAREGYFDQHAQYWTGVYKDIPKLKMPADPKVVASGQGVGERLPFIIDGPLAAQLRQYALRMDVSIYQLLLSVYYLLLSKYTGQQDLVVGAAVANRRREETQSMLGMFVNTLALRASVPTGVSFSDFVHSVKGRVLEAFAHEEYPFELLVARLGLSGSTGKVPLIDTLFIVQNIDFFSAQSIPGLSFKYENATATSKFDFSFFIVEQPDAFVLEVEYNTGLFSRPYMSRLAEDFIALARKAVSTPKALLEEISLVDGDTLSALRQELADAATLSDVEFDL
jgi:amino acid adenylation domain-containing protein